MVRLQMRHKHRGRKARAQVPLTSLSGDCRRERPRSCCRYGWHASTLLPHERDARAYIGLAIYFISTQRPPPVNTMTRFITTNIRS